MAGDGGFHGSGVFSRVRRRDGKRVFYIRYSFRGARIVEKIGPTEDRAREILAARRRLIDERPDYVPPAVKRRTEKREKRAELTFDGFVERFLREAAAGVRSKHYTHHVKHLLRFFDGRTLASITAADLDRWKATRATEPSMGRGKYRATTPRPVSPSTVRKEVMVAKALFRTAVRWGLVPVSPAVGLIAPAEPMHRTDFIPREQWPAVEAAAPPWIRPIMTLAVTTGLRLKECVALRWEDLDLERGLLYVAEDTKTGHRAVPVNATAREILKAQPRRLRSPFVFTDSEGGSYLDTRARNRITCNAAATLTRAGLPGVTFHGLRHTAASWMAQAGIPLETIGTILGHRDPKTTKRYAHLQPGHLREAAEVLNLETRRDVVSQVATPVASQS